MIQLPVAGFIGRVLISRERGKLHQADPYGHFNAGQSVNLLHIRPTAAGYLQNMRNAPPDWGHIPGVENR